MLKQILTLIILQVFSSTHLTLPHTYKVCVTSSSYILCQDNWLISGPSNAILSLLETSELVKNKNRERELSIYDSIPYLYVSNRIILATPSSAFPYQTKTIRDSLGNIFTVYSAGHTSPDFGIFGQRHDAEGSQIQLEFQISSPIDLGSYHPAASLLNTKGIVVVWFYMTSSVPEFQIYGEIYDMDYNRVKSNFQINLDDSGSNTRPEVCGRSGGGFVATWVSDSTIVKYRLFDMDGNGVSQDLQAHVLTSNLHDKPSIACFDNGGFVITMYSEDDPTYPFIKGQIFDENGGKVGSDFRITNSGFVADRVNEVKVISNFRFVVSWSAYESINNQIYTFARLYSLEGNPLGDEITVSSTVSTKKTLPDIASLSDGGFFIVWRRKTSTDAMIHGQRFDTNGNFIDQEIVLSSIADDSSHNEPSITALDHGGYAVSWYSGTTAGDIYLRVAWPCEDENCIDCSAGDSVCSSCKDSFYVANSSCFHCHSTCNTCSGGLDNQCTSCFNPLVLNNGSCICEDGRLPNSFLQCECPVTTFDTHKDPLECEVCDVKCWDCSSRTNCSTCRNGFFSLNGRCEDCPESCEMCESETVCSECKSSFVLSQGSCECETSFVLEGSECVYKTLNFTFNEDYELEFSENLMQELKIENIVDRSFLPGNEPLSLSVFFISFSKYSLQIEGDIPKDSEYIQFRLEGVIGKSGSEIEEGKREVSQIVVKEKSSEEEITENLIPGSYSVQTVSGISATTGFLGVLGISSLSLHPGALWNFLNFSIMVYLSSLQNIGVPEAYRNFTNGFDSGIFGFIPNLGELLKVEEKEDTASLFSEYDIKTSSLLINTGDTLFVSLSILSFLPLLSILYIFSSDSKFKSFLKKCLENYQWSFFLRFFIQSYTEISFSAFLSLYTGNSSILELISCCLIISLDFLAILILIYCIIIYRNKIQDGDFKRYESFFEEFNYEKGLNSLFYYPLFFVRRLVFSFGLCFLIDYPFYQVATNVFFSFLVVLYLICARPFKKKTDAVINLFSEIFLGLKFILLGFFLLDLSESNRLLVSQLAIICVLLIPLVSILVFLSQIIIRIYHYKKGKRRKSRVCIIQSARNNPSNLVTKSAINGEKGELNTIHLTNETPLNKRDLTLEDIY